MKAVLILAVFGVTTCHGAPLQYVWDLLKPALTSEEVLTLLASKDNSFPILAEIPDTKFQCSSMKQPGYYADLDFQCQVFHRCDQAGIKTSYICVNSTVFNQITLVCDAWFNVECERSGEFVDYANSRLYTDLPLFDTPPADYVAPSQKKLQAAIELGAVSQPIPAKKPVAPVPKSLPAKKTVNVVARPIALKPAVAKPAVKLIATATPVAQTKVDVELNDATQPATDAPAAPEAATDAPATADASTDAAAADAATDASADDAAADSKSSEERPKRTFCKTATNK